MQRMTNTLAPAIFQSSFLVTRGGGGTNTNQATVTEGAREQQASRIERFETYMPGAYRGLVEASDLSRGPKSSLPEGEQNKGVLCSRRGCRGPRQIKQEVVNGIIRLNETRHRIRRG